MAVALYYQYALAWEPCVLCIHIRVVMLGLMLLALCMIFLSKFKAIRVLGFLAQSILAVFLFMKCRELYRIEVGLQVRTACGESPELFFNISMAEGLYFGGAIAMVAAILVALLSLFSLFKSQSK